VTLTIVCIPLGGMLAARLAGLIIPDYGWRPLFMAGGIIPIVLALVLFKVLPESPRFLAGRRERWGELTTLLRRMGHQVPADAAYVESGSAGTAPRASLGDLFSPAYRRDTIALFASFFFCLMVNYIAILLIPVTFTGAGFPQADANYVLYVFNLGGVVGAILGALVIQRLGSRIAMLGMTAVAIAASLALAGMPLTPPGSMALMALMVLTGALLNGVQTTMYALAAHVYPTEIRGTGVGAAVAFGRIGNTLASFVGNGAARTGGNAGYFSSWAITMGLVFVALALIQRHIPRTAGTPAPGAASVERVRN
jgi:AAHS family 4-hydroxybenzoate transporter-like MFS transporter